MGAAMVNKEIQEIDMKKKDGSGNWYSRKWGNRRALINKARRGEKFALREEKNLQGRVGEESESTQGEFDGVIVEVQSSYYRVMTGDEEYIADI
jgi:hypothetical protein